MSMKPEQTVSNLWSCETLNCGIDHVMTAAKAEPVSDDEAERELLKQLQDRPKIQYLFSSNMFIGSIGFESVCTCMFSTGHLHHRRLNHKFMLVLVLPRHGSQVEFQSINFIKVSKI